MVLFCCARIYIYKDLTKTFEPQCCKFKARHLIDGKSVCGIHQKRHSSGKKWFGLHDQEIPAGGHAVKMEETDPWIYWGKKEPRKADDILEK